MLRSGTFDRLACALDMPKWSIAGKLLIGTIGIAVAVATTAATGGMSLGMAAATVGAEVFMGAAVGSIVGVTVYACTHKPDEFKIEDCLSEMGKGFVDGYAISGALSGVKGLVSFAKSWVKTGETTAKYTEVVSEGGKGTELFLPDEYYNKNLPSQVTPGTKYLPKYDEVGNVKQIKMYDDYGREIGWVDYTNHGYGNVNFPDYHTTPHWHERIYNAQYPDGIKINYRTDINTPLGDK